MKQTEIKYIKSVLSLHAKHCFVAVDMYTREIAASKGKDIAETYKQLRSRYRKEARKANDLSNTFTSLNS